MGPLWVGAIGLPSFSRVVYIVLGRPGGKGIGFSLLAVWYIWTLWDPVCYSDK